MLNTATTDPKHLESSLHIHVNMGVHAVSHTSTKQQSTGKLKDEGGGGNLVHKTFTLIHQSLTTGITVQMNEIIVFISVANHKLTISTLKGFQENTRVCQHSFLICVSSKEQLVQHVYDF